VQTSNADGPKPTRTVGVYSHRCCRVPANMAMVTTGESVLNFFDYINFKEPVQSRCARQLPPGEAQSIVFFSELTCRIRIEFN
jgi:hypothetical protein